MAFDYSGIEATASRLIGHFGKASVYIRATPTSSSDPVAGTVTQGTPVDTLVNGVQTSYNEAYQPGALIQTGDRMFAVDAAPNPEDQLIINGEVWEIV
ncbi:unnamed protein product, partial [marine sediment metagenome]